MSNSDGIGAITYNNWLGITLPTGTRCGIAIMSDGNVAGKPTQGILTENVGYPPHAGKDIQLFSVSSGDTGAFLPTVLKGKQSEKGETGYIFISGINTENPTRLVQV